MDRITTDVRMAEWTSLVQQCQSRPEGQTAKQWLEENGISSKQKSITTGFARCAIGPTTIR